MWLSVLVGDGETPVGLVGDWTQCRWSALDSVLARAVANDWVLVLQAGDVVEHGELLARAAVAIEANAVEYGDALAVQCLRQTAQGVTMTFEPVLWQGQRALQWDGDGPQGAWLRGGRPLRHLEAIDGVRIHRVGPAQAPTGVPTEPAAVQLPDPVSVASAVRADPMDLRRWMALLDTAGAGLALAGGAIGAENYVSDAPADVLKAAASTLHGLQAVDLLRPGPVIRQIANQLLALASAARAAFPLQQGPGRPATGPSLTLATADFGEALTHPCFLLADGQDPWLVGLARDLLAAGLVQASLPVEPLLAMGRPVLWVGWTHQARVLGQLFPGLVHVLLSAGPNPDAGGQDHLVAAVEAAQEGVVRLWWRMADAATLPGVTPLPVYWCPPEGLPDAAPDTEGLAWASERFGLLDRIQWHVLDRLVLLGRENPALWALVPIATHNSVCVIRPPDPASELAALWAHRREGAVQAHHFFHVDGPMREECHNTLRSLLARAGFTWPAARSPRQHRPGSFRPGGSALLVVDQPGWSFAVNADGLAKMLEAEGIFTHRWYVSEHPGEWPGPDFGAYWLPWTAPELIWKLPPARLLGALRTHRFDASGYGPPDSTAWAWMRRCAGFAVANRESLAELVAFGADDRVVYLPNPVDMTRFPEPTRCTEVIAEWNGTTAHRSDPSGDAKGLNSILLPACELAGVPLRVAEYHTQRLLPAEMPAFYQEASVALCASAHEGSCNSALEAMASGLAVITTDVGNARELQASQLQHFGESGMILVDRSIDAFGDALRQLSSAQVTRMGEINRQEVTARWSWEAWRQPYLDFFARVLQ